MEKDTEHRGTFYKIQLEASLWSFNRGVSIEDKKIIILRIDIFLLTNPTSLSLFYQPTLLCSPLSNFFVTSISCISSVFYVLYLFHELRSGVCSNPSVDRSKELSLPPSIASNTKGMCFNVKLLS